MTTVYTFTVPGKPQGKGRPRFAARGKYVQTYTPAATAAYEELVRLCWQRAHIPKLTGPLDVSMVAHFPIPKSTSEKKRAEMECGATPYPHKPDADNIAKAVLDALNGLAYDDDAQICTLHVDKAYGPQPCVFVTLNEINQEEEPPNV